MSHERIGDAISQLQAHDNDPLLPTFSPAETIAWARSHRRELHMAQEAILAEMEDVYRIEQVARGQEYGA